MPSAIRFDGVSPAAMALLLTAINDSCTAFANSHNMHALNLDFFAKVPLGSFTPTLACVLIALIPIKIEQVIIKSLFTLCSMSALNIALYNLYYKSSTHFISTPVGLVTIILLFIATYNGIREKNDNHYFIFEQRKALLHYIP